MKILKNPSLMQCVNHKKIFFLMMFAVLSPYGYMSIYSVSGMGMEQSPYNTREQALGNAGMAFIRDYGSSIVNPSKTGFNTKTTFEAAFNSDLIYVQDADGNSNRVAGSHIPFIGMNFQAGKYGNLGLSYFQKFERDFEFSPVANDEATETEYLEYTGGANEAVFSLASAVNYNYSIGLAYHVIWGRDQEIKSTDFTDPRMRDLRGDTIVNKWSGGYPALSFSYQARKYSFAFSTSFWQKIERRTQRKTEFTHSNQDKKSEFEIFNMPVTVGLGIHYKLSNNKHLVCDVSTSDWDQSMDRNINRSYRFGAGYEYKGLGGPYDSYYKKMSYRAGAGYEKLYLFDLHIARLTGGLGLPLGNRGSSLNLALELGRRDIFAFEDVQENYLKFQLSFIGAGTWGRGSRGR